MPSEKSKEIDDLLTSITGISRQEASTLGICTFCKKQVGCFRNPISRAEYEISGLCQDCQDKAFGKED